MAWTVPKTWVPLEYVTAGIMNTHVRDQLNELRGGGLAIASQAAEDFVTGLTSTQFTRRGHADVILMHQVFN